MTKRFLLLVLALALQSANVPLVGTAHAQSARRWSPTMIALVDDLPDARAKSMIVRNPHGAADEGIYDYILLRREGLNPNRLSSAIAALRTMRHRVRAPDRQMRIAVRGDVREDRWAANERTAALNLLTTLKAAPPQYVEGVGQVPVVVIFVRSPQ